MLTLLYQMHSSKILIDESIFLVFLETYVTSHHLHAKINPIFLLMERDFVVKPNTHFNNVALSLLLNANKLRLVKTLYLKMATDVTSLDVSTFNILIRALCKADQLQPAFLCLRKCPTTTGEDTCGNLMLEIWDTRLWRQRSMVVDHGLHKFLQIWFCCHMGISFSCPFAKYNDVEDGLDSVVVKSINFGNDEIKTPMRSVSFKNEDLEPTILKSLGSGKMTIEASIDPRHRYGHNLHFYYDRWLQSQSREPFFYWLDIGEGKEVNLEKCPRSKLQQQCIKYLGPMERLAYEVVVEDGKFFYKQTGELLNTGEDAHAKWIFVLSTSKTLYVGKKTKGSFQHSSFLAGGATSSAGRLVIENGVLKAVWPHSGHYRPTEENFKEFISFLQENNVSLSDVKMDPVDEADDLLSLRSSGHLRSHSSEEDFTENMNGLEIVETIIEGSVAAEKANLIETERSSVLMAPCTRRFQILGRELSNLEIPKRGHVFEGLENEIEGSEQSCVSIQMESQETTQAFVPELDHTNSDENLSDDNDVETIPQESILKRINSHKEMKSYQLGKQLSCKWTTGAGPRIGCVRDYPCELQFRALEQVNLSPRSGSRSKSSFAPRSTTLLSSSLSNVASLCGNLTIEPLHMPQRGESNSSGSKCSPLIRGSSVIPVIHSS
ncbi:hypothetical protein JHK85_013444 [Glycine max]|nr:hypothetical protein JHK85_013444 [Glycine max]